MNSQSLWQRAWRHLLPVVKTEKWRPQSVVNSAAHDVTETLKFHQITYTPKSLHWLRINATAHDKVLSLSLSRNYHTWSVADHYSVTKLLHVLMVEHSSTLQSSSFSWFFSFFPLIVWNPPHFLWTDISGILTHAVIYLLWKSYIIVQHTKLTEIIQDKYIYNV